MVSWVVAAVVLQEVMTFRSCCDLATAAALELTFPVATVVAQPEVPLLSAMASKLLSDPPPIGGCVINCPD
jgi:hypothetical protein